MTAPHADDIIDGYMARLKVALGGADSSTAAEVLGGVRSHIAETRAVLVKESDADILNMLDRLGEPSLLAADAGARPRQTEVPSQLDATPRSATAAVAVLVVGAVVGAVLGPFSLISGLGTLIVALLIARTSGRWANHEVSIAGLVAPLVATALLLPLVVTRSGHWFYIWVIAGPAISLLATAAYLSWTATRTGGRLAAR